MWICVCVDVWVCGCVSVCEFLYVDVCFCECVMGVSVCGCGVMDVCCIVV